MAKSSTLDQAACSLLLGLGVAQRDAGSANYRDTLREAGTLARALGSADLMAEAALANFRGFWSTSGIGRRGAGGRAERCSTGAGRRRSVRPRPASWPPPRSSWSTARTSRNGWRLSDQALAMARRLDQPATLAYLLRSWDLVHRLPWYLEGRVAVAAEHAALAAQLGDPVEQFWAVNAAQRGGPRARRRRPLR